MIDPDEDDQIMWEKTVLSSSNYAGLVSVLVDPSTEGGVPADAMNEVKIRGITGWKADFLFLCWCRDENNSGAIPMHLAGFSNAQLEDLHSRTDCFRDLLRQTELRGQVDQMIESLDEINGSDGPSLWKVAAQLDLPSSENFWQCLHDKLVAMAGAEAEQKAAEADRRKVERAPFVDYANQVSLPTTTGPFARIGNAIKHRALVDHIEHFYNTNGAMPRGLQTISYSCPPGSNFTFSPGTIDVMFPDD